MVRDTLYVRVVVRSANADEITQRYAIMILHEFTLCHVTLYSSKHA